MGRICCAFLILALGSLTSWAEDWPQWRGPHRNGISSERISTRWSDQGPQIKWSASVGTGFSGLSIENGRVCTLGSSTNRDTVWCFDAKSGGLLWKHTYYAQLSPQWYEGGPGATPTISSNRIYTISKWGDVFCFDATTGSILWQRDLRQDGIKPNRWGFAGSPLIWQDLVIFNAGGVGTALNRETGKMVWSNGTNATGYASPELFRVGTTECVLIFAAQHLVAVNPRTGAELWRYPWKTDWDTNNSDPAIYDDSIFISSFSRGCSLLSVKGGVPEPLYESKDICNNLSPGVLIGRYYYVFSGEAKKDTELRCLNLPSGKIQWSTKEPSFGSLIGTDGNLLVLTEKGVLLAFKVDGGPDNVTGMISKPEPIASAKVLSGTCWTPPSLANGFLYLRNAKGEVRCLDLSLN